LVWGYAARFRLEAEQDAMTQYIEEHVLYVVWADEITALNPRMCARTAVEGDGAPRACAVFKPAGKVFSVLRRLTSRHD
jgi:hypothetical protein